MAGLQPTMGQLRPALSLALSTARTRAGGPLPGRVRQIVRSRRAALPPDWLRIVHQALDEDPAFREAVAAEASEEEVGRLAWLWLARPEGWEEEVSALVESDAVEAARAEEVRVLGAQVAALEAELVRARTESESAAAAHGQVAAAVETSEREAAELRLEVRRAERVTAALQEEVAELRRSLAAAGADRDSARSEADAADRRVVALLADLEQARAAAPRAEERVRWAEAERAETDAAAEADRRAAEDWRNEVAVPIRRAAAAAADLGSALSEAAARQASLPEPGSDRPDPAAPAAAAGPPPSPVSGPGVRPAMPRADGRGSPVRRLGAGELVRPGPVARPARRPGPPARRPVALPPAVHDDSVEAAEHLMRVPGSELIVDGYNVALTSWSDGGGPGAAATDLPSLRLRLIDSLNELALRYQRRAVVVFDGIDAGTRRSVSGPARPLVRVVFSPSSVEADEVIVETVRHLAPGVPAIVATDDRAVRAAVSGLGANVVSVGQLLAVLRRQPSA